MTRRELVILTVLDSMCDDYENVDQIILPHVYKEGASIGLTINRPEVVEALAWLVDQGLAKAYRLSGTAPFSTEIQGMPDVSAVEEDFETYFYITPAGMELHMSVDGPSPRCEDLEA